VRLSTLGRNLGFLLGHAARQKISGPRATREWKTKQAPFVHRGARGIRFRLHPGQYIDERIYFDGIYERRFLEFLERRIRSGGAMLDVGANIGNHALYLRKRFDEVHCFEPNPTVVARLNENVALNGAENVHVHAVGLGSERGELPFHEVEDNLSVSRFSLEAGAADRMLPITTGDEWVEENQIRDVNYIKIDVEGFEGEVLKGLRRTVERFQPLITAEFSGHAAGKEATESELMSLAGYRLFEPLLEPGDVSAAKKIGFYLASAVNPELILVEKLESRYYPYLLAVPAARLREFGAA
jgi:FkbM family methyltransferase